MKKLIFAASLLLTTLTNAADLPKCKGITKAGKPCKSTILMKNGYCRAHNPEAIHCSYANEKGKRCGMIVTKEGEKCKFHNQ